MQQYERPPLLKRGDIALVFDFFGDKPEVAVVVKGSCENHLMIEGVAQNNAKHRLASFSLNVNFPVHYNADCWTITGPHPDTLGSLKSVYHLHYRFVKRRKQKVAEQRRVVV